MHSKSYKTLHYIILNKIIIINFSIYFSFYIKKTGRSRKILEFLSMYFSHAHLISTFISTKNGQLFLFLSALLSSIFYKSSKNIKVKHTKTMRAVHEFYIITSVTDLTTVSVS